MPETAPYKSGRTELRNLYNLFILSAIPCYCVKTQCSVESTQWGFLSMMNSKHCQPHHIHTNIVAWSRKLPQCSVCY